MEILTAKCMHSYQRGLGKGAGDFDLWGFCSWADPFTVFFADVTLLQEIKDCSKIGGEMT